MAAEIANSIRALKDTDDAVRGQGMKALLKAGQPAVAALMAELNSANPLDRKLAARALGCFGLAGLAAAPVLKKLVAADQDAGVRLAAEEAARRITAWVPVRRFLQRTAIVVTTLAICLMCLHPFSRYGAFGLLRGERFVYGYPKSYWLDRMQDPYRESIPAVVELAAAGDQEAIAALVAHFNSDIAAKSFEKGAQVARGLGQIGPSAAAAVPELCKLLCVNDEDFRATERRDVAVAIMRIAPADGVALFQRQLADKDAKVRGDAAKALGELAPQAQGAIPALIAALSDPDARTAGNAAEALGSIGPAAKDAVPGLTKLIENSHYIGDGREAIVALGQIGPAAEAAIPALLNHMGMLIGGEFDAQSLVLIGPKAVPGLIEALDSDKYDQKLSDFSQPQVRSDVRKRAIWALTRLGSKAVIPTFVTQLQDADPAIRVRACKNLGELFVIAEPAVPELITLLKSDPEGDVRAEAADALGIIGGRSPAVVPALLAATSDNDAKVRAWAANALGECGPAALSAAAQIRLLLKDDAVNVRYQAAKSLVRLGVAGEEVVPEFIAAISDSPSPEFDPPGYDRDKLRASAAEYIGRLGPLAVSAVPALLACHSDLLHSDDRNPADEALREIGWQVALPGLVKALDDDNELVRNRAIELLVQMGPAAKSEIPALINRLADPNHLVRVAAARVLAKIDPKSPRGRAALEELSNDENRRVKAEANNALGWLDSTTKPDSQ